MTFSFRADDGGLIRGEFDLSPIAGLDR